MLQSAKDLKKIKKSFNLSKKIYMTLLSVKFQIIVVSSIFLYVGRLSDENWVTVILTIAGFRTINEVSSMYKSVKKFDVKKKIKNEK